MAINAVIVAAFLCRNNIVGQSQWLLPLRSYQQHHWLLWHSFSSVWLSLDDHTSSCLIFNGVQHPWPSLLSSFVSWLSVLYMQLTQLIICIINIITSQISSWLLLHMAMAVWSPLGNHAIITGALDSIVISCSLLLGKKGAYLHQAGTTLKHQKRKILC